MLIDNRVGTKAVPTLLGYGKGFYIFEEFDKERLMKRYYNVKYVHYSPLNSKCTGEVRVEAESREDAERLGLHQARRLAPKENRVEIFSVTER